MKKVLIVACALCLSGMICHGETLSTSTDSNVKVELQNVVFRRTQKLRSNDGRSIYFYTNRVCELFDGDRLIDECTYTVQNGEVRLIVNGRTAYKGTYTLKQDGNLATLKLNGTTFYAF